MFRRLTYTLRHSPHIVFAILEHAFDQVIGEDARRLIAGDSPIEQFMADEQTHQDAQNALAIVSQKFRHNAKDQELAEVMSGMVFSGDADIENAVEAYANDPERDILVEVLKEKLKKFNNWRTPLSKEEIAEGVSRYLYELERALLRVANDAVKLRIIGERVLEIEQKIDDILNRLEARYIRVDAQIVQNYVDVHDPLPLPDRDFLPEPTTLPPSSRLDLARNEVFTGREDELKHLAEILLHGTGQKAACISTGYGGIGKTQLAIEFAYRFGRYFRGVHWISARSGRLDDEIAACGRQMGIEVTELEQQVKQTVAAWQNSPPRLIIIDNVENPKVLEDWWAKLGNIRVLITSRRTQWSRALGLERLDLKVLSKEQARELLRKLAPRLIGEPDTELDKIGDKLGYLPLALDLVGRYLDENADMSPQKYLYKIEEAGSALSQEALSDYFRNDDFVDQERWISVIACFTLSWQQLGRKKGMTKVNFLARKVLRGCGYCASNEPIPIELLENAFESEDKNMLSVREALKRLYEVGMLRQTQAGEVGPTIHPLMTEYARLKDVEHESVLGEIVEAAVKLTRTELNSGLPSAFAVWNTHMVNFANWVETTDHKNAGWIWNNIGRYQRMVGNLVQAENLFAKALSLDEAHFGNEHIIVAIRLFNLGDVQRDLGKLTQAKISLERSIKIDEAEYGTVSSSVALRVNSLGMVLGQLGDFAGAKDAYEKALSINEELYGRNHYHVATCLNNLGKINRQLGDLVAAKSLYEEALAIDIAVHGKNHPKVATRVNNLGKVFEEFGDLSSAQEAYTRALTIDESAFGKDHPKVAIRIGNLGRILLAKGSISEAKALQQRALEIDMHVFPMNHPKIANRLSHLGSVYYREGDLNAAKEMLSQALEIYENAFGKYHPSVAQCSNKLGRIIQDQGDIMAARLMFERALEIFPKSFSRHHPKVARTLSNLAMSYVLTNDLEQSIEYYEQALRILQEFLPYDHPSIVTIERSLKMVAGLVGNREITPDELCGIITKLQEQSNVDEPDEDE